MAEEKRRFSRINFDVQANVIVDGMEYPVERIVNLGVGGCLVILDHPIPVDTECVITLLLDGISAGVRVHGTVLRSQVGETSFKFTTVDPENLFHLQNILRYNFEDPDTIEKEICKHPGLK